jgi:uncharacterized membrane-anchored protein
MKRLFFPVAFLASFLMLVPSFASNEQDAKTAKNEEKIAKVLSNMANVVIAGPTSVSLSDQAQLNLSKDYLYIPQKEAAEYMKAVGNGENPNLIGLILNKNADMNWVITIKYNPEGYIREDDAKNWNADELLKSLTEGTEEVNKERKAEGYETFHVVGWIEKPTYDVANHKLIWSMEGKMDDTESTDDPNHGRFVNYNTYALGRHGYFELTLMTDKSSIDSHKVHANNVLNAIDFNSGNRYEDFVEGKDRVAEYGLAALILGVAAKKLGLIAMAGVFLLKMWKLIAIGFLILAGFLRRIFAGKKKKE